VSRGRPARVLIAAGAALAAFMAGAPTALAADGVGLWGRTDDKVITFFAFALMAFFAILVTVLSLIQIRLESRKERIRRELERLRPPAAQ
jgi:type VI protein secretion system component VasF